MKIHGSVSFGSVIVSPGPMTASGVLHEHVEGARFALRMLPVIADAAQDLARPRQRRA
jgi:hypothetical protein